MANEETIEQILSKRNEAVNILVSKVEFSRQQLRLLDEAIANIEDHKGSLNKNPTATTMKKKEGLEKESRDLTIKIHVMENESVNIMFDASLAIFNSAELQHALTEMGRIVERMNTVAARMLTVKQIIKDANVLASTASKVQTVLKK